MRMINTTALLAIGVKVNAKFQCVECGSGELVQAHHIIKGDDNSMICLCAECHSQKHPYVAKALFFAKAGMTNSYSVESQIIKENGVVVKCPKCGYKWLTRVERPKACSRCKIRFDAMMWKFVDSLVTKESEYEELLQQLV